MKIPAKSPDEKRLVTDQIPYAWWARIAIWGIGVWDALRTVPPKSWGRQREASVGDPGFDESMLILVKRRTSINARYCQARMIEIGPGSVRNFRVAPLAEWTKPCRWFVKDMLLFVYFKMGADQFTYVGTIEGAAMVDEFFEVQVRMPDSFCKRGFTTNFLENAQFTLMLTGSNVDDTGCSIDRATQTDLHPSDLLGLQAKPTLAQQLIAAKRIIDLDGKQLDLEWFRERVYLVRRVREESVQLNVSVIDAICSDSTAGQFIAAMKREIELKYGPRVGQLVARDDVSAFPHTRIDLLDVGATLAVLTPSEINGAMRKIWTDSERSLDMCIPDSEIWLVDFSDIDLNGGVGSPERHLVIKNFKGFTK